MTIYTMPNGVKTTVPPELWDYTPPVYYRLKAHTFTEKDAAAFTARFAWDTEDSNPWDDTYDELLAPVQPATKHLPGQHDQLSHGGGLASQRQTSPTLTLDGEEFGTGNLMSAGYPKGKFGSPKDFINNVEPKDIAEMFSVPGVRATVGDWNPQTTMEGRRRFDMSASLYTTDTNEYIGHIQRSFKENGEVYHAHFEVDSKMQGRGYATLINGHAEDYYRSAGFESVTVLADITIGRYAWAQQGFDYLEGTSVSRNDHIESARRAHMSQWHGNPLTRPTEEGFNQTLAKAGITDPKKAHAWQIAALDDGDAYQINAAGDMAYLGKSTMLKEPAWSGRKDIRDGSPSRKVGDAYFRKSTGIKAPTT